MRMYVYEQYSRVCMYLVYEHVYTTVHVHVRMYTCIYSETCVIRYFYIPTFSLI